VDGLDGCVSKIAGWLRRVGWLRLLDGLDC
jgi:hypothetical protein